MLADHPAPHGHSDEGVGAPEGDPEVSEAGDPQTGEAGRPEVSEAGEAREAGDACEAGEVGLGQLGQHGIGSRDDDRPEARRQSARHVSPVRLIRRPWAAGVAVAGVVIACAAAAGLAWAGHTARPPTPIGRPPLVPIPVGHWAAAQPAKAQDVPLPTGLVIPEIGVRTSLIHLGLTPSGALQVPASTSMAGWYTGSPRPGATGSAVIVGHIDSVSGPGVFFRLRELRPGDLIYVRRDHAGLAVFKVTAVQTVLKSKFPTDAVYGPVPDAQLRLITCGGAFNSGTGHYVSNVVVFAVLA
jgi:hypothetical protein